MNRSNSSSGPHDLPSKDPGPGEAGQAHRERRMPEAEGEALRRVARDSIRHGLDSGGLLAVDSAGFPPFLRERRAAFVTLMLRGELRGCIGSIEPRWPLVEDVCRNAHGAAFRDPRFPPVTEDEFSGLEIHLSLLTLPTPLPARGLEDLLGQLRPGVDGLLLEDPPHRATFLPQVWEVLPDPRDFVGALFRKAGLSGNHWSPALVFHRYEVEEV